MCGISGFWSDEGISPKTLAAIGNAMAASLTHRGPDAGDTWIDGNAGIALSHRRLSILDLSSEGAQPMLSSSGRYVIVYNGEIYNHLSIRSRLDEEGAENQWRGHSDTETLLAAIEAWGLEKALYEATGMFALALWDITTRTMFLARDRMGEKPLYYGRTTRGFAFASELRALFDVPGFNCQLDHEALQAFLDYGYVPDPRSLYSSIRKLQPGGILKVAAPDIEGERLDDPSFFHEVITRSATGHRSKDPFDQQSKALEELLGEVVASQMISDVPLGSFLSGGIDSSLITALLQANSDRPIKSFSIGFEEADFDESAHASAVAKHLGTEHTEFRLKEDDALALISELPRIYSEPFADSSQIPTALLCRQARSCVTVALTGDGGDEVFGGYNRYIFGPRALKRARALPRPLRRMIGPLARLMHRLGGSDNAILRVATARAGLPTAALNKIARLGENLGNSESIEDLYGALTRVGADQSLLRREVVSHGKSDFSADLFNGLAPAEWMMAMDSVSYLPGDILVKVDRASMAASLETRAPFLDRRAVEAAWHLPPEFRIQSGSGKRILLDILDRHVPRKLIERPKQGFAVPLDKWLRGDLRSWAEDLLSKERLQDTGIFNSDAVRSLWKRHIGGTGNEGQALWPILMLMAWLEEHSDQAQGWLAAE